MYQVIEGKLVKLNESEKIKFRTNISKALLIQLEELAKEQNTHKNYLIEFALKKVLEQNEINYNKKERPKDRIQYKTTYNKKLLEATKTFAKNHGLFINDVIEYCVQIHLFKK